MKFRANDFDARGKIKGRIIVLKEMCCAWESWRRWMHFGLGFLTR